MSDDERKIILDAWAHLAGALAQSISSDDQIIIGHMRDAADLLHALLRAKP
jgi:hypothetical protein